MYWQNSFGKVWCGNNEHINGTPGITVHLVYAGRVQRYVRSIWNDDAHYTYDGELRDRTYERRPYVMQVKVRKDARLAYIHGVPRFGTVNWHWADLLKAVEGRIIEVETDYLFRDQFNTVPIPGVSESGLRLMNESIEAVIDDIRPYKMR